MTDSTMIIREVMEPWQAAWRVGIAPELTTKGLEELAEALREDSPEWVQGASVLPYTLDNERTESLTVEAGCALCYSIWRGEGSPHAWRVLDRFREVVEKSAQRLEEAGLNIQKTNFLVWHDSVPREKVRTRLLAEVEMELQKRQGKESA